MTFFQDLINHPLMASVVFSSGLMFVLAFRLGSTSLPPSFLSMARLQQVRVRSRDKSKGRVET